MAKVLDKDGFVTLISTNPIKASCKTCSGLVCKGWESVPSSFDLNNLQIVGTLRVESTEECWEEYHPKGTNLWSPDAPIAIKFHPYNRSDIYECKACQRKFLRYTEYGGYYLDERIREVSLELII